LLLPFNGKAQNVSAGDDTPLLWALRYHLKTTGTKFGCGAGLCGACAVHVDGETVLTALSDVDGKQVTSIEELAPNGDHALTGC
jgi:isoquinoline 1-oxidoreductase alpha subunit